MNIFFNYLYKTPVERILFLGSLLYLGLLWTHPIYILDESMFTEAAREMLISGNWWIPHFNGELFVDKPPLQYYFMLIGFKIFGVNAFGARFFSGFIGLVLLLETYRFCKLFLSEKIARTTLLILMSSFFFVQQFQLAVPDPYLISFCCFGLFSFYRYYQNRNYRDIILCYFFLGIGVLAKGPVAMALPGISIGLFLIKQKKIKQVLSFYPFLGCIGIILIAFPWFWKVHESTNGEWTRGFIMTHNVGRFTNVMEGHGGPFVLTIGYVLLGLLPFSFFLPQAFIQLRNEKHQLLHFASIVVITFILFFGFSATKLPNYTMPCYPFLAVLIAYYIEKGHSTFENKYSRWNLSFLSFLYLVLPFVAFIGFNQDDNLKSLSYLAITFLPATLWILFGSIRAWKAKIRTIIPYFVFAGWSTQILLFGWAYPKINETNPVTTVKNIVGQEAKIVVYQRMDRAFPFNFQRIFPVVKNLCQLDDFLSRNPSFYVLTNSRNTDVLDKHTQLVKIHQKKSPFEYHVTKLYEQKNN